VLNFVIFHRSIEVDHRFGIIFDGCVLVLSHFIRRSDVIGSTLNKFGSVDVIHCFLPCDNTDDLIESIASNVVWIVIATH